MFHMLPSPVPSAPAGRTEHMLVELRVENLLLIERAELRERLPDDAEEIVLGRRVGADGRTRAFVQGRSASAADLRELGARLISFYGQHEHRKLTIASAQLDLLDGFAGDAAHAARGDLSECHAQVLAALAEVEELRG